MVADLSELDDCDDIHELLESLDCWSVPFGSIGFGADRGGDFRHRMVEAIVARIAALRVGGETLT